MQLDEVASPLLSPFLNFTHLQDLELTIHQPMLQPSYTSSIDIARFSTPSVEPNSLIEGAPDGIVFHGEEVDPVTPVKKKGSHFN